jgi:hypothetical protein
MALAFPDGVRPRRLDRALLVAVYGFAVVHGLLNAMFAPAFQGRSSVLQVGAGSETIIGQAGLLYLVPVAAEVIIIVLVVSRWIRATSVTRRGTGAVVLAAALTLGYTSISVFLDTSGTVSAVVLMIIPVALVAAVVWSRSRRVAVDDLVVGLGTTLPPISRRFEQCWPGLSATPDWCCSAVGVAPLILSTSPKRAGSGRTNRSCHWSDADAPWAPWFMTRAFGTNVAGWTPLRPLPLWC